MEYFYNNLDQFLILIPLFPLIGFIINGLAGKRFYSQSVVFYGCGSIFLSFVISFIVLIKLIFDPTLVLKVEYFSWITSGDLSISLGFYVDTLSAVMINIVAGIGFLIHVYSAGYMKGDPSIARYFAYLNLFCFSMLILVMGDNLVLLFLGWEGVGLCSYLLIGFWYSDLTNASAGKKAFIVNRIGDFGFLIGMFLIYVYFQTLNMEALQQKILEDWEGYIQLISSGVILAITLLLFMGATGKSAQIPLYVWLPDAMQGPTPVSALIHAATMVTAGVYMIARLNFLFFAAKETMFIIMMIAGITAVIAGLIAITQRDIKRVLAYSTISQLGYMFMAMGAGAFAAGIFHLMTHAFFKALLFLAAGSVIIATHHEQDMFKMGGLQRKIKITFITFIIGAIALSGILPFTSGFLSKDLILENVFFSKFFGSHWGYFFWGLGVAAAAMTALYTWRLIGLTFSRDTRMDKKTYNSVHETYPSMTVILIILAALSLFGGWVGIPEALGGSFSFGKFLSPVFDNSVIQKLQTSYPMYVSQTGDHGNIPYVLMFVTLALGLILSLLIWRAYYAGSKIIQILSDNTLGRFLHTISYNKFFVDEIYEFLLVRPVLNSAKWLYHWMDRFIIEGIINKIIARYTLRIGTQMGSIQDGSLNGYALIMILGSIIVIGYILFKLA